MNKYLVKIAEYETEAHVLGGAAKGLAIGTPLGLAAGIAAMKLGKLRLIEDIAERLGADRGAYRTVLGSAPASLTMLGAMEGSALGSEIGTANAARGDAYE